MADCIFCKIANKDIPSTVVYEDETVIAFNDLEPQAPFHALLIPKKHVENVLGLTGEKELAAHLMEVAGKIAKDAKLDEKGFRIVTNTGDDGGQSVHHLHFHILGGRKMSWPPG